MEGEYEVAHRVSEALGKDVEELFVALSAALKKKVLLPAALLGRVIVHGNVPSLTKIVALRILMECLQVPETAGEYLELFCSVKCLYVLSEIVRREMEESLAEEVVETPPECTIVIMEVLAQTLELSREHGCKDRLVLCLSDCRSLTLLNAWAGAKLLQVYAGVFDHEEPQGLNLGLAQPEAAESMPYRILAEEEAFGTGHFLVHRRKPALFVPQYFATAKRVLPTAYKDIFAFQDEYGVVHNSLVKWLEGAGNLIGIEWVVGWYLDGLVKEANNQLYERELLFVLGPAFHSSLTNSGEGKTGGLIMQCAHFKLLAAAHQSSLASVRGACSVAMQRFSIGVVRGLLGVISAGKSSLLDRFYAGQALARLLVIVPDYERMGLEKVLEKNVQCLVELLEIEPQGLVTEHVANVLDIISYIETIPLKLFAPSVMVLLCWVIETVPTSKKHRVWVERYLREVGEMYQSANPNVLLTGLGY
ncbi:hypothetical protein NEHOM01_1815 [Nematocida homosporus]|uniref:uncharacterized protein n=1 Tax=Nematocida homosporus TaxID=1912981 RepID=UPI00221F25E1|nr:uncharacterized protein NEHOM01_1815 [Nematocida homosporus]KAI5186949.1 hypothetical protein NEHOM01_1815 [Nematocida homosporus]